MKYLFTFLCGLFVFILSGQDLDDDGMNDTWEQANGLDPSDAKDAWLDPDNDQIINLFEYQMNWNPDQAGDVATFDFTPESDSNAIRAAVLAADSIDVYIRLAQGRYLGNLVGFYTTSYRLFIQGGWNDDFSEFDPTQNKAIISYERDEAISVNSVSEPGITHGVVICQGLQIDRSGHFVLAGGLHVGGNAEVGILSVIDCSFYQNNNYGISFSNRGGITADFFLVNSDVLNNYQGGIYTQVTEKTNARFRIINSTIHNPFSSEGGIVGLTQFGDSSNLRIDCLNSIIRNNNDYDFSFSSANKVSIFVENSNVGPPNPDISDYSEVNSIDENSLFENSAANNVSLLAGSPCIDQGIDVGLPFMGMSPDMGAKEFGISAINSTAST